MFRKSFLSTTLLLLTLGGAGLGMSASHGFAGTVARVASGQVIFRTGPATSYKVIETIPVGAKVQINGCLPHKSWCFLHYNGKAGWASARYLNVNNIPTVTVKNKHMKSESMVKTQKKTVKQVVPRFKNLKTPQKIRRQVPKLYKTDIIVDSTGVKKRDERTILNPSKKARGVSVKHVNAYNPMFPHDVNFRNFERNETRYRVVTYPAP
ncbi:SH3 domain-containing protein [Bartonella rattaustraliani]|uniref:SH3 domain-containing protein n=1 Tax=Bartonella rattaustraliani TaxID=481139 RepID=UPI0002F0D607|nr:SH3 domain-containing protein [Bartonella rattaustraliani]